MPSIEKQNIPEEIKPTESPIINDEKQETPVDIILVEGKSGTLYNSRHFGNGIPDELIYK